MPYRHAHWWIAGLFPVIVFAFWPGYFGQLRQAPFALHAHGVTASLWLALVAAQNWSIQARHLRLHRTLGLATFALIPAFAAGGTLAMHAMAALYVAQATPFHTAFGARLVIADAVAAPVLVGLVAYGLAKRRRVELHAAALIATVILVLPPVLGRLVGFVPGIGAASNATGLHPFVFGFHGGEAIALFLALWLARRDKASSLPFVAVAGACLVQVVGFETLGRTAFWATLMAPLVTLPVAPLALSAAFASGGLLCWAWLRVPPRRQPAGRMVATT